MKGILSLAILTFMFVALHGQGFEIPGLQENYRCSIGETIKAALRFKNTTDKSITLIVRKVNAQIGSTQKNYFCVDNICNDSKTDDLVVKIDAGQTLSSVQIALEGGLVSGESNIKYIAYNKYNPAEYLEFDLNFVVEEKPEKQTLYNSRQITLHDVYPNPVSNFAYVDYRILHERSKVRIVLHNILGNKLIEYDLPFTENLVKIRTDELSSGIYFYTLYVNNESVLTHKLIVRN